MRGSVLVGVDLVSVARMRESMEKFGEKFLRRVFTDAEIAYCTSSNENAAERFAARFAAKEAVLKILRVESAWMDLLPSIEIVRAKGGWCELTLRRGALAIARRRRISGWSVSLSHEAGSAVAVVAAEVRNPPTARGGTGRRSMQGSAAPRSRRRGRSKREDG